MVGPNTVTRPWSIEPADQGLSASGGSQPVDTFLNGFRFGLDILEIRFAGLCFSSQVAQVGFQLGDALVAAGKAPPEASPHATLSFAVVPTMVVALSAATAPPVLVMAAAAALVLVVAVPASAGMPLFVMAAFSATAVAMVMMVASAAAVVAMVFTTAALVLAVAAATLMTAVTSAISAHVLHPPLWIWNCCSYSARNRSSCARVPRRLTAQACRYSIP
jgi:hypothetical protein